MRTLLDTSVLVPALVNKHPRHERASYWLRRCHTGDEELYVSSHSLLELYAVLTRLPTQPKIDPATAHRLIWANILPVVRQVVLDEEEYTALVESCASKGHRGGVVYDALIAFAAEKAGVEQVVTFNGDHFRRCLEGSSIQIVD